MKQIFDAAGRLCGSYYDSGSLINAFGPKGEPVGRYSKSLDRTLDRQGRFYGRGNLLVALIMQAAQKSR